MINTDDIVKGDGAMALAIFPEGRKGSGKSKLIGFYKTADEVFAVICTIEFKGKAFFREMKVPLTPH